MFYLLCFLGRFEYCQILQRYDCSHRLAVVREDDPLLVVAHAVNDIGSCEAESCEGHYVLSVYYTMNANL